MERRNLNEPLFWMDSKGNYHLCRKRRDEMRQEDDGFDLRLIAAIFAVITAIVSPFVTMAVAQEKLRVQEESNKSQWEIINYNKALTNKHEALIPILQSDIRELKEGQKESQKVMYQILRAVKQ